MPQTTNALSSKAAKVYISTDGSTFTDISGYGVSVEGGEQSRISGEAYTFDGDTAVITSGKLEPIEITVKSIYTEENTGIFETARALFEAGTTLYLRWQPAGNASGDFIFTTSEGVITSFQYPPIDAASGDPILCAFTLKVARVTKTAVAI